MIPMTHDPLCQIKNPHPHWTRCASCYFIAKVREDMLAKCVAAVEDLHPKHCFPSDHPYQMKRAAIAALRALQERP
jgi:uncharacterized protein YifN (PemK superfamily)